MLSYGFIYQGTAMARTYKTTKARTARILSRRFIQTFNEGDTVENDAIRRTLKTLEVNGVRLGNNRKGASQEKILKRRARRKKENQAVFED